MPEVWAGRANGDNAAMVGMVGQLGTADGTSGKVPLVIDLDGALLKSDLQHEWALQVETTRLDRFMSFDPISGILRAEAGASLTDILALAVPHGFFFPSTPGTRFLTLGGAVANDVHGKNHHRSVTFGCHVRAIGLMRGDGDRVVLSASESPELFGATIGGLGSERLARRGNSAVSLTRCVLGPGARERRGGAGARPEMVR